MRHRGRHQAFAARRAGNYGANSRYLDSGALNFEIMGCSGGAVLHAEYESPQRAAHNMAAPAARPEDRAGQLGVGTRHDVHSDGVRPRVSDGGGGLGEPQGTLAPVAITLEALQSNHWKQSSSVTGCRTSSTRIRAASSRWARSPRPCGLGHPAVDGRQGKLARYHVRRAGVAQRQVRGGLLESVRVGQPCSAFHRRIHRVVQPETVPCLADQTPDEAYFATLPTIKSAA